MKKITSLLMLAAFCSLGFIQAEEPEACSTDANKKYYTPNAVWTNSDWYKIIDIDAAQLGGSGIQAHTGADGSVRTTSYNSGVFTTPVYKWDEASQAYVVNAGNNWSVKYYLAAVAPTFYTSARTKTDLGTNTGSSFTDACYGNNNTVKPSPIWNKQGFIELSRQASEVLNTAPSRHGYIQIDDLPQVERVQWSFSSLAWKRGVKLDIKHGNGEWEPLRWEASNVTGFVQFAEQGYEFEEIIGKQEDPTSKISLRWRIWDGDSIHVNPGSVSGSTFGPINPYGQQQDVRIHQIRIFSGVDAPEAPTATKSIIADAVKINLLNKNIVLSEIAKVEIYSYDGRKLFAGTTNRIDVSEFGKGLYIIKAVGASGKSQKKIVL